MFNFQVLKMFNYFYNPNEKENNQTIIMSQDSWSEVVGRLAQVKLSLLCRCESRAMTSLQDLSSLIPALLDYRAMIVNQELHCDVVFVVFPNIQLLLASASQLKYQCWLTQHSVE